QDWSITATGRIAHGASECLEVPADAAGTPLRLAPCADTPGQRFGWSGSVKAVGGDMGCLGTRDGRVVDGRDIVSVKCNPPDESQPFKLTPDGRFHLTDSLCLGHKGSSGDDLKQPAVRPCHGPLSSAVRLANGRLREFGAGCLEHRPTLRYSG